ncbi:hypothetical protein Tco_0079165 [Tanacetum coccineum]
MISMNITSPSSSLVQSNFVLEDWGTNLSDSSIELSFHTCSVAMEANGSGYGCGLEFMFPRFPFSSCPTSGSLSWDSLGCLGWIVMALTELWMWVEHCGSIVGYTTYLPLHRYARMRIQQRLVRDLPCNTECYGDHCRSHIRARSSNNAHDSSALRSRSLPPADWTMIHASDEDSPYVLEHQDIVTEFLTVLPGGKNEQGIGSKIPSHEVDGSSWIGVQPIALLDRGGTKLE